MTKRKDNNNNVFYKINCNVKAANKLNYFNLNFCCAIIDHELIKIPRKSHEQT